MIFNKLHLEIEYYKPYSETHPIHSLLHNENMNNILPLLMMSNNSDNNMIEMLMISQLFKGGNPFESLTEIFGKHESSIQKNNEEIEI